MRRDTAGINVVILGTILLASVLGPSTGWAGGAGGGAAKKEAAACKKDSDCVLVADGCCDCSAGGKQKAVPARQKAAHERERKKQCAQTMCTAMISTDPSCEATPVCKAGACIAEPRNPAPAPGEKK